MIDDHCEKFAMNPIGNCVVVDQYRQEDAQTDECMKRDGPLHTLLENLARCSDIQSYCLSVYVGKSAFFQDASEYRHTTTTTAANSLPYASSDADSVLSTKDSTTVNSTTEKLIPNTQWQRQSLTAPYHAPYHDLKSTAATAVTAITGTLLPSSDGNLKDVPSNSDSDNFSRKSDFRSITAAGDIDSAGVRAAVGDIPVDAEPLGTAPHNVETRKPGQQGQRQKQDIHRKTIKPSPMGVKPSPMGVKPSPMGVGMVGGGGQRSGRVMEGSSATPALVPAPVQAPGLAPGLSPSGPAATFCASAQLSGNEVYVCMYTYVRTHIHTYVRTYIHTYIRTYIYIHTYIHTYVRTYIHTYIHTYTHTYTHTHIDA